MLKTPAVFLAHRARHRGLIVSEDDEKCRKRVDIASIW